MPANGRWDLIRRLRGKWSFIIIIIIIIIIKLGVEMSEEEKAVAKCMLLPQHLRQVPEKNDDQSQCGWQMTRPKFRHSK